MDNSHVNLSSSEQARVAFWNLQNLFDINPSPMASELGFSAITGWDRQALEAKLTNLASGIRGMFNGDGPDLIGLAEVQNERVAQYLLSALGCDDYALVTTNHPQTTATDTALIYSKTVFDEESVQTHSHLVHQRFLTCDILEVQLTTLANNSDLTVLVNHWPSRRDENSDAFRQTIASHCSHLVNRRLKLNRRDYLELSDTELSRHRLTDLWNTNLLLMGSFNDNPWDRSLKEILNAGYSLQAMREPVPFPQSGLPSWRAYASRRPELFNPTWSLLGRPDRGTCMDPAHPSAMSVYDQLMISRGLVTGQSGLQVTADSQGVPMMKCLSEEILANDFGQPIPFSCDTYNGYSDRLPIGLMLEVTPRKSDVQAITAEEQESCDQQAH